MKRILPTALIALSCLAACTHQATEGNSVDTTTLATDTPYADDYFIAISKSRALVSTELSEAVFGDQNYLAWDMRNAYHWPVRVSDIAPDALEASLQAMVQHWWTADAADSAWWDKWKAAEPMERMKLLTEADSPGYEEDSLNYEINTGQHGELYEGVDYSTLDFCCANKHFCSYILHGISAAAGANGCHNYVHTFNFNFDTRKALKADEVFKNPKGNEFKKIIQQLTEPITDGVIVPEDYITTYDLDEHSWFLAEDGVHIIFGCYEIACGAVGVQEIVLNYYNYSDLYRPDFIKQISGNTFLREFTRRPLNY